MADLISFARRLALVALWLSTPPAALAAGTRSPAISPAYDYAKPELFSGTLYEIGSDRKKPLFTFQRRATRSGDTVHVERRYFGTNGGMTILEKLVYESNQLVSYRMQEFQAQVSGTVLIARDPKNPAQQQIFISYGAGLQPQSKAKPRTSHPIPWLTTRSIRS